MQMIFYALIFTSQLACIATNLPNEFNGKLIKKAAHFQFKKVSELQDDQILKWDLQNGSMIFIKKKRVAYTWSLSFNLHTMESMNTKLLAVYYKPGYYNAFQFPYGDDASDIVTCLLYRDPQAHQNETNNPQLF